MLKPGEHPLVLRLDDVELYGDLVLPVHPQGLVIFAHGSGSSRHSRRNRQVAAALQQRGFATLLFDLLTEAEDRLYENRFNIEWLTERLLGVTALLQQRKDLPQLPLGYFGASTGAACALNAAAALGPQLAAVVSRGGRPDLALARLAQVQAPTLLIVGGHDDVVIGLNQMAYAHLRTVKQLVVVPGATHLFEEPGTLEQVEQLAGDWFEAHCSTRLSVTPGL